MNACQVTSHHAPCCSWTPWSARGAQPAGQCRCGRGLRSVCKASHSFPSWLNLEAHTTTVCCATPFSSQPAARIHRCCTSRTHDGGGGGGVQVLLDRGVSQDRILFLSMIAAPEAVHRLCTSFPAMKLLTSEVDRGLDDDCRIVPGVGEFGER